MRRILTLATLLVSLFPLTAMGQISADLIVLQGDVSGSSTVASVNAPFVNGLGQVGFNVLLQDKNYSVWFDGAEVFNSTSVVPPNTNVTFRSTMGFGNAGEFVVNPNVGNMVLSSVESIRNQNGEVLAYRHASTWFYPWFQYNFSQRCNHDG